MIDKVIYNNTTLIDLTECTVDTSSLLEGKTAYDKSGNLITGTLEQGIQSDMTVNVINPNTSTGACEVSLGNPIVQVSGGPDTYTIHRDQITLPWYIKNFQNYSTPALSPSPVELTEQSTIEVGTSVLNLHDGDEITLTDKVTSLSLGTDGIYRLPSVVTDLWQAGKITGINSSFTTDFSNLLSFSEKYYICPDSSTGTAVIDLSALDLSNVSGGSTQWFCLLYTRRSTSVILQGATRPSTNCIAIYLYSWGSDTYTLSAAGFMFRPYDYIYLQEGSLYVDMDIDIQGKTSGTVLKNIGTNVTIDGEIRLYNVPTSNILSGTSSDDWVVDISKYSKLSSLSICKVMSVVEG